MLLGPCRHSDSALVYIGCSYKMEYTNCILQIIRDQRLHSLQKCCAKHSNKAMPNISKSEAATIFRNVIVDRKNRLLYCYVPKVASTNVRKFMLALQGTTDQIDAIKVFDRRGFEFFADFSTSEREHIINTYLKFMFVRHPLERLVSAYRHRVLSERNDLHSLYGKQMKRKNSNNLIDTSQIPKRSRDDVTFREFVQYLIRTKTSDIDRHFRSFFDICQPCSIHYNFIGSISEIDLDIAALMEKLNVSRKISFPKRQANYKPLSKKEALSYYQNVTNSELSSLRKKYGKDFDCFLYGREFKIRALPNERYVDSAVEIYTRV